MRRGPRRTSGEGEGGGGIDGDPNHAQRGLHSPSAELADQIGNAVQAAVNLRYSGPNRRT